MPSTINLARLIAASIGENRKLKPIDITPFPKQKGRSLAAALSKIPGNS
jgi:hypothetical protein